LEEWKHDEIEILFPFYDEVCITRTVGFRNSVSDVITQGRYLIDYCANEQLRTLKYYVWNFKDSICKWDCMYIGTLCTSCS